MNLETKYNIEDVLFFYDEKSVSIISGKVTNISVDINRRGITIIYSLDVTKGKDLDFKSKQEPQLFTSKRELIDHLNLEVTIE